MKPQTKVESLDGPGGRREYFDTRGLLFETRDKLKHTLFLNMLCQCSSVKYQYLSISKDVSVIVKYQYLGVDETPCVLKLQRRRKIREISIFHVSLKGDLSVLKLRSTHFSFFSPVFLERTCSSEHILSRTWSLKKKKTGHWLQHSLMRMTKRPSI